MDDFINNIKQYVPMETWLYIALILVVIIVLSLIMSVLRRKKAKSLLEENEIIYNELKGIPLAFKLNKAVALSRVNKTMMENVDECEKIFEEVQEKLKSCSLMLAEVDDMIYGHKVKTAIKKMDVLNKELLALRSIVDKVNKILDDILEQENEQRVHINKLKDDFRELKKKIKANSNSYHQCYEYMEIEIASIEKMFSVFEELMFASKFNKSWDQQKDIRERIADLDTLSKKVPGFYERAKGSLPRSIDEVGYAYSQCKNQGIYLDHLEVHNNLGIVSDLLKEVLKRLRNGNLQSVDEDLTTCEQRVEQLKGQIHKENEAHKIVDENASKLFELIQQINHDIDDINELYNRVCTRFGFENWTDRLEDTKVKLIVLNDMKRKLEKVIKDGNIENTSILVAYKELEQSANAFNKEVQDMKQKLVEACSDEDRAKKQLVKLQLILNEIRVKMVKNRLPSVSNTYEADLTKGTAMVQKIQDILNNSPLDVKYLNFELRKTIDYVYTLYNNVNNLAGMATMVENVIVFGNRYRSSYPEIDSELTRADLCFRNGEYTKALKIGLQCIEKIHPGAYEKMMKQQNDQTLNKEAA